MESVIHYPYNMVFAIIATGRVGFRRSSISLVHTIIINNLILLWPCDFILAHTAPSLVYNQWFTVICRQSLISFVSAENTDNTVISLVCYQCILLALLYSLTAWSFRLFLCQISGFLHYSASASWSRKFLE